MCSLMSSSSKDASEPYGGCDRQDKSCKKGLCLLELRHTSMVQWSVCRRGSIDQHGENNPQISCINVKEELKNEEEALTVESLGLPDHCKRKRLTLNQLKEARAASHGKQSQTSISYKHQQIKSESTKKNSLRRKKKNLVDRWSIERYNLAEKRMLEVLKAEGAVFENPISRPLLRMAARKHVCDTGLLDHLLKHMDGKVAPGGTERFRRCYNTEGVMVYWLESADLVNVEGKTGVPYPHWAPVCESKPSGDCFPGSVSAGELTLLKEEIAKMKRDMEELVSKNQKQDQSNPIEEMHKELLKWRKKTDQCLMEMSSSLSGIQDMCGELVIWKSKTEKQINEILDSLSNMQSSKQCTNFSPASERWEDWLESTNLDNIKGEDFAPWLESTGLANFGHDDSLQVSCSAPQPWLKPCDSLSEDVCIRELQLVKEGMVNMNRDVQELAPNRMETYQANVTPDSCATVNSKFDLGSSFLLFQEMFKELVRWKAKMEQQMLQISDSVSTLQGSKQYAT
uniref:PTC1-like winged helix-turn-helix domain-containing protein n=1 Tax=Rhizophora mucronata TaxID=61149 RepID=A0A2P2KAZ2_RHIMU